MTTLFTVLLTASLLATPATEAALASVGPERAAALAECGVDDARLAELLALDQTAFDQTFGEGWRWLHNFQGCEEAAADLIALWRDYSGKLTAPYIIYWHEGQMRAYAGQTEHAAALFDQSRTDGPEWNLYVDASIAFLRGDHAALTAARDELATYLPTEDTMAERRQFLADNPQFTMHEGFVEQPQNLGVVDRLLACFGQSYRDAYGGQCQPDPSKD
ncbi:MAG: hypothetical protein AAGH65_08435 [Pseudomonadota bacterium]